MYSTFQNICSEICFAFFSSASFPHNPYIIPKPSKKHRAK